MKKGWAVAVADDVARGPAPRANVDDPPPGSPDYILAVLKHLEEEVHAEGWDKDPKLYALVGHGDEANGWISEALVVNPVLWHFPYMRGLSTTEKLGFHVRFLAGLVPPHPLVPRFPIEGLTDPPLKAFVMVAEAWGVSATPEEREKWRGTPIADNPAGVEMRTVFAVLPDATVAYVDRTRGVKPDPISGYRHNPVTGDQAVFGHRHPPGAGVAQTSGAMVNLMRVLVNAVNKVSGAPQLEYFYGSEPERRYLEEIMRVGS